MPAATAPLKLAAAACVLLFGGLGIYLAPLQPSVVALQFTFTPDAFAQVLQAWGPAGVQRFRTHLPVDGFLLLSYGAAGYLAVTRSRFFDPLATGLPLRWVALLLPLAAVGYLRAGLCAAFKWVGVVVFTIAACMTWLRRELNS